MYQISVEQFEGPLDLLLSMVEEQKLSINEISLAEVANQYISYLKSLEEMSKEELAAFLVIASTLMLIKSRSLIPNIVLTEEEETDIQELEIRLKAYKFFKKLSSHIRELSSKNTHLFGREAYSGMSPVFLPPETLKTGSLLTIINDILTYLPKKELLDQETIQKAVSLEEKMAEFKDRLEQAIKFSFDEIKKLSKDKVEVIVSFLAMLELIKQGFLVFEQKKLFGSIELTRHE